MVQLLNVCCAPCALPVLSSASDAVLYFYNPNIYPKEEYARRIEAARETARLYKLRLIEGEYDHDGWVGYIKEKLPQPPESYPENGERCLACFEYRLRGTAKIAKEKGFGSFATTLSVSRFKDTAFINEYGVKLAAENQLTYATFPLNAGEAHRLGLELSKKHGIYRQKYCGCEFSVRT